MLINFSYWLLSFCFGRYEKARSLVVKVFGPKFHKKFPRKRRPCSEGSCSCGGFPSTGGDKFDKGVDVLINRNAKVTHNY